MSRMSEEAFEFFLDGTNGSCAGAPPEWLLTEARRARASEAALREENERLRGAAIEAESRALFWAADLVEETCRFEGRLIYEAGDAAKAIRERAMSLTRAALSKEPTR